MGELGLCKVLTSHVDPAEAVDLDDGGSTEGERAEAGAMRFVLSLQLDGK